MTFLVLSLMLLMTFVLFVDAVRYPNKEVKKHFDQDELRQIFHEQTPGHDTFEEYDISTIYETSSTEHKSFCKRYERKAGPTQLRFRAFGEDFHFSATKVVSILHPNAKIITAYKDREEIYRGLIPDCFMAGHVISHSGTASLSYCDKLQGGISTKTHHYHVTELPRNKYEKRLKYENETVIVVSKRKHKNYSSDPIYPIDIQPDLKDSIGREKRSVLSRNVTLELGVLTDSKFTELFQTRNTSKRIELLLLKYFGVQMEYSRANELGYNIKLQIQHVYFYEHNPTWYNMSYVISTSLSSYCAGMRKSPVPYDLLVMHTGITTDVLGRAYQSSVCNPKYHCSINSDHSFTDYRATTHEIGHNLGMYHDSTRGCRGSDVGIMGGYGAGWSSCSINDMDALFQSGNATCLWEDNVFTNDSYRYSALTPILLGQNYSVDEVCEILHQPGFRFRTFPRLGICQQYSCVNYNEGDFFGQMLFHKTEIPGAYCGDGKICFKKQCVDWDTARQKPGIVRQGNWGPWDRWRYCSRTCGTGIAFRRRLCNNPTPLNHPSCPDEAYEATICNTVPCPTDSSDPGTLIVQRASETCSRMINNHVVNSTLYTALGNRYSNYKHGQCEVKCQTLRGYKNPTFTRFGLMPHGTPCSANLDAWDLQRWPRRQGYKGFCLDGYCKKFGCDGILDGAVYDGCGKCGGDGTSCHVVQGFFKDYIKKGNRKVVTVIPVEAYNIQIWFVYSQMKQYFLELFNKDNLVILASFNTRNRIFTTGDNPINFANSYWSFHYPSQYLFTKGPITEPVIIKLYQNGQNTNKGVNFAYSMPKSALPCHGQCQNGGMFNITLCACSCPSGYYGNTCSSRCNIYCQNGAKLNPSTCTCQCGPHQSGRDCACDANYSGENCTECKPISCGTNQWFNKITCQCECPPGFSGPLCQNVG